MPRPRPVILYKYLDAKGALAFLQHPQLRFSDWRSLDDLTEAVPGFRALTIDELEYAIAQEQERTPTVSPEKIRHWFTVLNSADQQYLSREWRTLLKRPEYKHLHICSTSCRFNSGPMWSQYGQGHRGLVFGFKPTKRLLGDRIVAPVNYARNRPKIPFPLVDSKEMLRLMVTKSLHWKYQAEWRILSAADDTLSLGKEDLAEIIVGERASENVRALALEHREKSIPVFTISPHPADYRLIRAPLESLFTEEESGR